MSTVRTLQGMMLWAGMVAVGCGDSAGATAGEDGSTGVDASSGTLGTSSADTTGTSGSSESGVHESSSSGAPESTGAGTGEDACASDVEPSETVVVTTRGAVEGSVTQDGPVAFLGIPYAAPPTGERRWASPQEPACWSDVLVADTPAPWCPQLESATGPVIGDEDCLHLNVWTPAADDTGRPVLLFIHGGGNAVGSGSDPLYDGAKLSAAGDQVVVTINYRLGALGWLTHDDLPAVNFGLRDQVAALQWVRDNAAAFGGDPERVTVFGESGGAVNTCTLVGSPLAAGLFRGAIVQSGACSHRTASDYAEQMPDPFVQSSGCADAEDPLSCLRALPAESLPLLEPTGHPDTAGVGGQGWGPSLDPETLPVSSIDAMEAGTHNDVPMIIGANAEENWNTTPEIADEDAYVALVTASFGPLAPAVLEQYPVADYDSPRDAYVALTSDLRFVCTARRSLRAASFGRSPVYRYHFAHDDYFSPSGDTGAFHGLELLYIFGNFDQVVPGFRYPTTPADESVRDTMQGLWTSFAAGALSSEPAWPEYEVETDPYLLIEDPVSTGEGVRAAQCDFWEAFVGG